MPLTFAMIGMVRKDRCRAEQLLGEHRADEQVRPGGGAERQEQIGRPRAAQPHARLRRRSESAPRASRRRARPPTSGKVGRGQSPPRSSSDDRDTVAEKRRDIAAFFRQLGQLRRPCDSLQIAFDQLGLRRAADLPARNDVEEHLLCGERRTKRPGEDRLEAVVDRPRGLGDGARTVGAAAREDRNRNAAAIGQA